jgi:hypothetical protein
MLIDVTNSTAAIRHSSSSYRGAAMEIIPFTRQNRLTVTEHNNRSTHSPLPYGTGSTTSSSRKEKHRAWRDHTVCASLKESRQ